jgi:hypothetical protein
MVMELIFEIRDAEEGGFYARALGHAIFTEAGRCITSRTSSFLWKLRETAARGVRGSPDPRARKLRVCGGPPEG